MLFLSFNFRGLLRLISLMVMILRFVFVVFTVMRVLVCGAQYPLALGGLILLLRGLVVVLRRYVIRVFYRIVLLLVFVGGLLVAFGYAVALASNPVFRLFKKDEAVFNFYILGGFFVFLTMRFILFYSMGFNI